MVRTGAVREDLDVERVADVLWLAMDVRNYDWLVRQRGWTLEQYQDWYVRTSPAPSSASRTRGRRRRSTNCRSPRSA